MDETIARTFLNAYLLRLALMMRAAQTRPPSMPSCLPTPARVDMFVPADEQRPGTLLVVLAGTREDLDPTRWRVRRYRGELFPLALGLELPGRWFPPQTVNIVLKNIQLVDMTPVDEGDGTTGVLLVDGCRFEEGTARPGFRRARSREVEWAHHWLRIPERFFTTASAEAQSDSHFHFYSSLPSAVAADGAGSKTTVAGVRNQLEELLRAYRNMLSDPDTTEGQLHLFLKQHHEFFGIFPWAHEECPIRDPSTSKIEYWADFAFRRPEGDYDFYEIEKSGDRVFRTSGDLTAKANHALEQVENWLRALTSNLERAREAFPGLTSPRGCAVVGLRAGLGADAVQRFRGHNREGGRITAIFFDDLADRLSAFIDSLPG